jgi:ring-1,2-phenylacetyl-CoA epoxidase subunit PaaE
MASFFKLSIKEITHETKDTVSIAFNVPQELKPDYQFVAGQYVTLKIVLDNQEIRRSYSICSAPESGELRVAVKAVKKGVFSSFATSQLKAGDVIEVGKPEGKFVFEPNQSPKNYAAFAAGSGITPIFSIIQAVLSANENNTFVLAYGNKTTEDTIFYKALNDLKNQFPTRFFIYYTFTQAKMDDALFGRIDRSVVNYILNNKHTDVVFDVFYLCGPEDMIALVSAILDEKGIDSNQIKKELFSSGKKETAVALEGQTKITILVDGEETSFEMSQKETILEAALKQKIEVPYSCQGGVCSSCLAKVTQGTAQMKKNSILTDSEVADGLTLTCQAHPTSEHIFIDFDDV